MKLDEQLRDFFDDHVQSINLEDITDSNPDGADARRAPSGRWLVSAAAAVAIAAGGVAVAAVVREPSPATSTPDPTEVPSSVPTALPLNVIRQRLNTFDAAVAEAQRGFTVDCAAAIGIADYAVPSAVPVEATIGDFGLTPNPDRARTFGYSSAAPASEGWGLDGGTPLTQQQIDALREYLIDEAGDDEGGCLNWIVAAQFGTHETWVDYVGLRIKVQDAARYALNHKLPADSGYQSLVGEWEACMADAGYPVDVHSPIDGVERTDVFGPAAMLAGPNGAIPETSWPTPRPSEIEVNVALTDVGCKESLDFTARANVILAERQTQLIDDMLLERDLATLETILATADPNPEFTPQLPEP